MMSSQLWRTILSSSPRSADEQDATADASGSYGELVEAIDGIVGEAEDEEDSG